MRECGSTKCWGADVKLYLACGEIRKSKRCVIKEQVQRIMKLSCCGLQSCKRRRRRGERRNESVCVVIQEVEGLKCFGLKTCMRRMRARKSRCEWVRGG